MPFIKQALTWWNGRLRILGMARSQERGVARIVWEIEAMKPPDRVVALHTRRPERAKELAAELAQATGVPLEETSIRETGVLLSTHGGPGSLAATGLRSQR